MFSIRRTIHYRNDIFLQILGNLTFLSANYDIISEIGISTPLASSIEMGRGRVKRGKGAVVL
jgi:hypothetical protein